MEDWKTRRWHELRHDLRLNLFGGPHNKLKFVLYAVGDEPRFISICIQLGTFGFGVRLLNVDPKHDQRAVSSMTYCVLSGGGRGTVGKRV